MIKQITLKDGHVMLSDIFDNMINKIIHNCNECGMYVDNSKTIKHGEYDFIFNVKNYNQMTFRHVIMHQRYYAITELNGDGTTTIKINFY